MRVFLYPNEYKKLIERWREREKTFNLIKRKKAKKKAAYLKAEMYRLFPELTSIDEPKQVHYLEELTEKYKAVKHLTVGVGWDISCIQSAIDIDVFAFAFDSNGKINSGTDVVFFNNRTIPGVHLNDDNTIGNEEGDDETIDIDLSAISPDVDGIAFNLIIYDAVNKRQTFAMINNLYVRLMDKDQGDEEICRFIFKDNYSTDIELDFAHLVRNGSDWDFFTGREGKLIN